MVTTETMPSRILSKLLPVLIVLAGATSAAAVSVDDLLRPQEAFRYAVTDTGDAIEIDWALAEGYYLYRERLGFESATPGVVLGEPDLPRGLDHEDEFFGVQQVYRERFHVSIPYEVAGVRPKTLDLVLRSQGCADLGVCFPPQAWTAAVELAPTRTAREGRGLADTLAAFGAGPEFLPVDEAFRPQVVARDGNTLELAIQVEPGYYLYRDKISVRTDSDRVQLGRLGLPRGKTRTDEYFGTTEVYPENLLAALPLARSGPEPLSLALEVGYQGCAEDGICYPPVTRTLTVQLPAAVAGAVSGAVSPAAGGGESSAPLSEQARLAGLVTGSSLWLVLATFFGAGLLLAFTPCVLPMIPILSGIIAGDRAEATAARGFLLALTYVAGMALVYTAAGVAAAAVGVQLQAVFNQPPVLIAFAALFVVLALGMFGLFNLQMPTAIQTRLAALSGRQSAGTLAGAFVMGALSSLIVTACVAPPLVAALTVIGQSGDMLRGGLALFALSLGMGAPLLALGASAGRLLPRAGPWMEAVKNAFGFVMLGLALWMLSRILPAAAILALAGVLVFMAGVWLGGLTALPADARGGARLGKGFGLLAMLYGAALLVGALAGGQSMFRPLEGVMMAGGGAAEQAQHEGLRFERVKTVADLDRALAAAAAEGRPAMLDFYADWCVSCIEMEKYTFSDPAVQAALADALLLQADVTANDAADRALLERFGVYGPPTIVFFGPDGEEREGWEVVGFMKAAEFAAHAGRATAAAGLSAGRAAR